MPISLRSLAPVVGALMVIVGAGAVRARAEKCNFFTANQPGCCFNIVVAGDARPNIDICKTCNDATTDPFASCSSHSCTATFDGTNTTFTFCGSCQPSGTRPHFGLDGGGGGTIQVLSASWSCSSSSPGSPTPGTLSSPGSPNSIATPTAVCAVATTAQDKPAAGKGKLAGKENLPSLLRLPNLTGPSRPRLLPASGGSSAPFVSVTTSQVAGSIPTYFTVYVRGTQTNDPTETGTGAWIQQPYPSGQNPVFSFENNTTAPIWLNDVGIIANDSSRPIDDLNFTALPPPPNAGSPFTALSCMDNLELLPGTRIAIPLSCPSSAQNRTAQPDSVGVHPGGSLQ
jgi:hypothetical protein